MVTKEEQEEFERTTFRRCMDCRRIKFGDGWVLEDELIQKEIEGKIETTTICPSCMGKRR